MPREKSKAKIISIDEHLLPIEDVCKRYRTEVNFSNPEVSQGLKEEEITKGRQTYGENVLSPPKKKHPMMLFLECVGNLFNVLLIVAGVLTFILFAIDPIAHASSSYLGAILCGVALLNALIEYIQLQKSADALASFLNMIPQSCRTVRNGNLTQIEASGLVPGDIVFVRMGDKVPADLVLFDVSDMKVDNSSLTGESEPQFRSTENDMKNPLEAHNLTFNGTLIVSGEGYGVVIRIGDSTVLGQIANMTSSEEKNPSPLSVEISNFVKIIAFIATVTAITFFILGVSFGRPFKENLTFAIGVFAAWVPEGLPATVTMLLTIAAKRMASRNVLVKDLQGVETLGAITLLATDKTGTLTRNQMTVTNIWSSLNFYATLRNLGASGNPTTIDSPGLREVMMNSSLNSRAKFDRTDIPISKRKVIGDATETGLVLFAAQNLPDYDELQTKYPRAFDIPFNSDNKWAMTISHYPHGNGPLTLFMKGAPERVLRLCSTILIDGQPIPLSEKHRADFKETYELMAGKGHRVLAFAQLNLPGDVYNKYYVFDKKTHNYPTSDLTFVGLTSLEDPPKHGVREAIGRCRAAGVRVMMVTGDHPLTAEAIGRKINLVISDTKEMVAKKTGRTIESINEEEFDTVVIHGEQIDNLTDEDWDNIFSKNEIIFARTSPKHKLEIVKRAQSMGHIVGVTGDGVNDSPALKKADLGIAMNESGSDVSKEAASMILLDDNFASTVHGIEEGRLIFTNLKKSIRYSISHSIPEIIPQLLYIVVPMPLFLNPLLILAIDLGFELCAALTYAWDLPETKTGLMKLMPRKPVDENSVYRYRRDQKLKLQPTVDPESGDLIQPTGFQKFSHGFKQLFSFTYWKYKFESTNNEVVVDFDLLSWGYLEAGVIEMLTAYIMVYFVADYYGIGFNESIDMAKAELFLEGNTKSYVTNSGLSYTAEDLFHILRQFQATYFFSIVVTQGFNLFACKARNTYPFGKHMFTNIRSFIGLSVGYAIVFLIIYTPGVQKVFNTAPFPFQFVVIPIIGGTLLVLYSALRFFIRQRVKPIRYNPNIYGLQMHPTVRTGRVLTTESTERLLG